MHFSPCHTEVWVLGSIIFGSKFKTLRAMLLNNGYVLHIYIYKTSSANLGILIQATKMRFSSSHTEVWVTLYFGLYQSFIC